MASATGLYGHIQDNSRRSLRLFVMFVVAFQLLAAVALFIPLLLFDPAHAPVVGGWGYFRRYVPLVALLSLVLFAAQMWWFVGGVRQAVQFRYVDDTEEPRFCRILETLAITAGITVPYAGVKEAPALNAFAAGVRDDHMVVVVTRGLLDDLDDDELAAILANAVIHIRNRDTQMLASATVFMRNMLVLDKERGIRLVHPIQGIVLVAVPTLVPVALVTGFMIQLAYRLGYASRALIGISRELVADAEAVQLTLNPAALASALGKIDQRHGIDGINPEYHAMLIVGATHGPLATHPTLDERLGALARTTGSLVLDRSRRLDTRPTAVPETQLPPVNPALERIALLEDAPTRRSFWGAFRSVRDPKRNMLGLDRRGVIIMVAALLGIAAVYRPNWKEPQSVVTLFDPRGFSIFFGVGPEVLKCVLEAGEGEGADRDCKMQADRGVFPMGATSGKVGDGNIRNGSGTDAAPGDVAPDR